MLALAGAGCGEKPRENRKAGVTPKEPVRITQFYAGSAEVPRGGQVLLCYGVENARGVRIEPGVDNVRPAYNKCVTAWPLRSTTYTMTAEGADGLTATASVVVKVTGAAPLSSTAALADGPAVVSFRTEKKPGLTLLCYEVDGAAAVAIEPGVLARSGALRGCLGVAPQRPTTYTLTAYGAGGRTVQRSVAVSPE